MSDPLDPLAIGGGGLAGAGVVGLLVKALFSGALEDVKAKQAESRAEVKEALAEFRADMREQMSSLKESLQRNDDRHDKAIEAVATLTMKVNACHQRLDEMGAEVRELERRMDKAR